MADDAEIEELRADMKRWKGIAAAEADGNEAHRRGWEAADLEIERLRALLKEHGIEEVQPVQNRKGP